MSEEISKYFLDDDKIKKFTVFRDDEPDSPRMFDNVGELYIEWGHRKEHYGDDFKGKDMQGIVDDFAMKYIGEEAEDMSLSEQIKYMMENCSDQIYIAPVYGYEHGDFTISLGNGYPYSDRFDGGCAGFIFVTKERCDYLGAPFENAKYYAENEVSDFDNYLRGFTYGCCISEENEEDEFCCGFFSAKYGDDLIKDISYEYFGREVELFDEPPVEDIER